jgi:hypothetical protein
LPIILDAQQLWFRRHGQGRHYQHLAEMEALSPGHGTEGFGHVRSVHECFDAELRIFTHATTKLELSRYGAGKNRRTHIDVHPQTMIPDVLLSGPFDREMCDRLFWLMKAGARLSSEQTWEVSSGRNMPEREQRIADCR